MKKMSAVAACGLSALIVGAAAPSYAETPAAPVAAGNLVHTPVKYVCEKGVPNFMLAVRAAKTTESVVTVSSSSGFGTAKAGPVTTTQAAYFFATKNLAGAKFSLNVKGATTGSSFSVNVAIPKTCAGLPGAPTKPTNPKMPVTPVKPGKPAPVMPKAPSQPAAGPKVQTDYVRTNNGISTSELALGAFGLTAAAAAGSLVVARRSSRR